MAGIGIVAIGRNEGTRFQQCLESFKSLELDFTFVYVDSGSTDNSVNYARAAGYAVVELDTSIPFTAARARNAGVNFLKEMQPDLAYIQFIDGDCQIDTKWLSTAMETLDKETELAVVCGRRAEIKPDASLYNLLIDKEWDTPIGYAKACGGDAMYRASAFFDVNGFNDSIIAGEEPELCYRLRKQGWKIKRIDESMTYHDAALYSFGAWWKRAERYGHAAFEGAWRYGREPERYYIPQVRGIVLWGGILPVGMLLLGFVSTPLLTAPLFLLLVQWLRLTRYFVATGNTAQLARKRAGLTLVCKLAEFKGGCRFIKNKLLGRRSQIIEYKGVSLEDSAK